MIFILELWQLILDWDKPLVNWKISTILKYYDMYSVGKIQQKHNRMCYSPTGQQGKDWLEAPKSSYVFMDWLATPYYNRMQNIQ